jgi:ribonucleoside-triphosphate reductase
VQSERARDQFERQAQIQHWWSDNAVSATLSFDPNTEREEMAGLLKEYVPQFKSTSMLAKTHGYTQAPYEQIDVDEYARRVSQIDAEHPLTHGGDFEIDECASGACPLR